LSRFRNPDLFRASSAYIHVPFCRQRCGYCNFALIADRQDLISEYLKCLEWELAATLTEPRKVTTLFLGGGTPTHLPPRMLERLLDLILQWLILEPNGEFSCEANPLDCSKEQLAVLKDAGVNRLSLGGQSFQNRKLKMLERDHTGDELQQTIESVCNFFGNVSLDLIFAAPEETLQQWQLDLDRALDSPIRHLSTYGLTIERGSQFYNRWRRGTLIELEDELQLAMYEYTMHRMQQAHWLHYEVSNFCLPNYSCRHNLVYWNSQSWWAFGPGAASLMAVLPKKQFCRKDQPSAAGDSLTNPLSGVQWRLTTNHRSTTQYIKRIRQGLSPVAEREILDAESWIRQRLVFGLRQIAGVDLSQLELLWGQSIRPLFEPFLSQYIDQNWLEFSGQHLRLTRAGLVISDSLWPELLASKSD